MSEASGMSMPDVPEHVVEPDALRETRLITQVLVDGLSTFGTGSGGPKRQPVIVPVHVPPPVHSPSSRHGLPALSPPTHAGYSGSSTPPAVQVRVGCAPPMSVGVLAQISIVLPSPVQNATFVTESPMSGTVDGSGTATPPPPK